jgi:hypothetical protein
MLRTKNGKYPLFVTIYPSPGLSSRGGHLDGLRSGGGVGGSASLCTSPGVTENLTLSGEIYNASMATGRTTEGSLLELRVLELTIVIWEEKERASSISLADGKTRNWCWTTAESSGVRFSPD